MKIADVIRAADDPCNTKIIKNWNLTIWNLFKIDLWFWSKFCLFNVLNYYILKNKIEIYNVQINSLIFPLYRQGFYFWNCSLSFTWRASIVVIVIAHWCISELLHVTSGRFGRIWYGFYVTLRHCLVYSVKKTHHRQ